MFYVNSSSEDTLDPRPAKAACEATTLIGLLQKVSPKFKKGNPAFTETQFFFFFLEMKYILIISLTTLFNIKLYFGEGFREILERKASAHPFENVQSLLPANSWLGIYPLPGKL